MLTVSYATRRVAGIEQKDVCDGLYQSWAGATWERTKNCKGEYKCCLPDNFFTGLEMRFGNGHVPIRRKDLSQQLYRQYYLSVVQ